LETIFSGALSWAENIEERYTYYLGFLCNPQTSYNDARCPYSFKRTQFPVRLAYAMTINKSQGQTLEKVGIGLKQEVFSHSQLYTGFSRTTSGDGMGLVIADNLQESRLIKNVVWRQVLLQD
jgi:ATP-dependent DNA helicase PIF1